MNPVALPELANQDFSLIALFLRADIIVKMVMGILLIASIWSWAVAIDKWFGVGGAKSKARKIEAAFAAGQPMEGLSDRVRERAVGRHGAGFCGRHEGMARSRAGHASSMHNNPPPSSSAPGRRWAWP